MFVFTITWERPCNKGLKHRFETRVWNKVWNNLWNKVWNTRVKHKAVTKTICPIRNKDHVPNTDHDMYNSISYMHQKASPKSSWATTTTSRRSPIMNSTRLPRLADSQIKDIRIKVPSPLRAPGHQITFLPLKRFVRPLKQAHSNHWNQTCILLNCSQAH